MLQEQREHDEHVRPRRVISSSSARVREVLLKRRWNRRSACNVCLHYEDETRMTEDQTIQEVQG